MSKTGHIVICGGGTGIVAGRSAAARNKLRVVKPIINMLVIDTDEKSAVKAASFADDFLDITVPFSDIETYLAEPERLSPVAAEILAKHSHEFNSMSLGAGAGSRRYVTQFMYEKRCDDIVKMLASAIVRLRRHGITKIQFHVVGSDAGGTGSAIVLLTPYLLADPGVKARLLMGCENMQLIPPILHIADVSCHVKQSEFPQRRNILANKFITMCQLGNLLRQYAPNNEPYVSYVTMTGAGNSEKHLETIGDVEAELGATLAMQLAFHDSIKSVEVDRMFHDLRPYSGREGISSIDRKPR